MLRIALPNKGRLSEDVRELFREAGLDPRVRGDRALTASLGEEFEAIFVRAQDIPGLVADGAADVGVTGNDLVAESGRELRELLDLQFGRCRLVVAVREDAPIADVRALPPGLRIATSFPELARRYFEARALRVEVVPVSGATESAPYLGIADAVVDLTSTGSTLRMNALREIDTILESSARLVARPRVDDAVRAKLEELTLALGSVLRARDKRYVMANAPRTVLDRVREILPGLSGPTVTGLLDGDRMVAVHAVVRTSAVYRVVAALKSLGCEGILVTRIERLVP